ncbi:MAG: VanW family protein [Eubacterium sp.]|nr:VanW family protein [Eubacterium sp.]
MGKRQAKRLNIRMKSRGWRDLLLAVLAVLCSVYILACTMPKEGRIIHGVYVNHADVSGMTREEAALIIRQDFEKSYAYQALTVKAMDRKYPVLINHSLQMDAKAAAEEAYAYGHGRFISRGFCVLTAALPGKHISWNAHVSDEEALSKAVQESGLLDINTTTQTSYEIIGDEMIFTKGAGGLSVDQQGLMEKLKAAVKEEDYVSVIDSPMVPGTVEKTDMEAIYQEVHTKKRNATLNPKKKYRILPSRDGVDFDVKSAQESFDAAEEGARVVIPLVIDKAEVSTADLKRRLFRDVLGECTLELDGTQARQNNIKLAAEMINGKILLAGKSFSFNKTVGERTEEKGFRYASAYNDGQEDSETGAGVSETASALYKAAVLSNLKIKKRRSSYYTSNYMDMGMNAFVSWEDPDLVFTDNTKYPVKIEAECSDGKLTVRIIGTKLDKNRVELTAEIVKMTEYGTVYREDPALLKGDSAVIREGEDGYTIQTWRKIYDENDKLISSKKEALSEYHPKDRVIAEGTGEPEPSTQAGSSETGEGSGETVPGSSDNADVSENNGQNP